MMTSVGGSWPRAYGTDHASQHPRSVSCQGPLLHSLISPIISPYMSTVTFKKRERNDDIFKPAYFDLKYINFNNISPRNFLQPCLYIKRSNEGSNLKAEKLQYLLLSLTSVALLV